MANVVLLGALSTLLPIQQEIWEKTLKLRIPARFMEANLKSFQVQNFSQAFAHGQFVVNNQDMGDRAGMSIGNRIDLRRVHRLYLHRQGYFESFVAFVALQRQQDCEGGALARHTLHFDASAVLLDDTIAHG